LPSFRSGHSRVLHFPVHSAPPCARLHIAQFSLWPRASVNISQYTRLLHVRGYRFAQFSLWPRASVNISQYTRLLVRGYRFTQFSLWPRASVTFPSTLGSFMCEVTDLPSFRSGHARVLHFPVHSAPSCGMHWLVLNLGDINTSEVLDMSPWRHQLAPCGKASLIWRDVCVYSAPSEHLTEL
jgi:uncharacterized protein YbdZ (MbtH family)